MQTEQINVRIDAPTKLAAEAIFSKIGVSNTDAIRMFYRQVIMQDGLPFMPRASISKQAKKPDTQRIQKIIANSLKKHKTVLKDLADR